MRYVVVIGGPLAIAVLLVLAAFPPGAAVAVAYLTLFAYLLFTRRFA